MLISGKDSFPAFNLTAARGKDGKVYVAVANMDAHKAQSIRMALGIIKARSVFGKVLTHTKMDAHNVPGAKDVVAPVAFDGGKIDGNALVLDVPAKSVVVVRLD